MVIRILANFAYRDETWRSKSEESEVKKGRENYFMTGTLCAGTDDEIRRQRVIDRLAAE